MTRFAQPAILVLLFVWSWLYRYNDPEGGFGGLKDDHFFYLLRGWQILYGDLPFRDFVDPGAPLTFYVAAAVQWLLGRGTWSEVVFCVTALSVASALTYWIARRASGSTLAGLIAAVFQVALHTRFYNYPKVLVYAVAIPALWAFADRPTRWRRLAVAAITATAFLLRYDHGVFVGIATLAMLALMRELPWRARVRHAVVYGLLVLLLLTPYLVFLQASGSIVAHFTEATSWAQRDRGRAPFDVPSFQLAPPPGDAPPEDAGWWQRGVFRTFARNIEPWMFYVLSILPCVVLGALVVSKDACRPDWPRARAKIAMVAVLALVLNIGLLRGHLAAHFGDVSVPHAVLVAWLMTACAALARGRAPAAFRAGAVVTAAIAAVITTMMFVPHVREQLENAGMMGRLDVWGRFAFITHRLKATWPLPAQPPEGEEGEMRIAYYLAACTQPDDRVFISQYFPQVPALAGRAFAGGHGDLRPGFFTAPADQRLTIRRLERQSVPVAIVPAGEEYAGFRKDFPAIDEYFSIRYAVVGDFDVGRHVRVRLLVDRHARPVGTYAPLGWPCFR